MVSRFKALVVVKSLGLLSKSHDEPMILLTNIIIHHKYNINEFEKLGHSFFEVIMLAWSISKGQMNNHCALHAHTDGNLSHEVETITLFRRTPSPDSDS
jgi:hypothetical protein